MKFRVTPQLFAPAVYASLCNCSLVPPALHLQTDKYGRDRRDRMCVLREMLSEEAAGAILGSLLAASDQAGNMVLQGDRRVRCESGRGRRWFVLCGRQRSTKWKSASFA
ncbi:hypothetical protein IWZ00DRAFT_267511 [Phyllosticta capitalensis]